MTRWRRIRSAAIFAAAGAALLLGVVGTLPLWTVQPPAYILRGGPTPAPHLGFPVEELPPDPKGSLWEATSATLDTRRYLRRIGATVPLVKPDDCFVHDGLILLLGGAAAGLVASWACVTTRRWKGGGA